MVAKLPITVRIGATIASVPAAIPAMVIAMRASSGLAATHSPKPEAMSASFRVNSVSIGSNASPRTMFSVSIAPENSSCAPR